MDDSKPSVPGSAEPQLRNGCLSFWSVKAELGLRSPGRGGTTGTDPNGTHDHAALVHVPSQRLFTIYVLLSPATESVCPLRFSEPPLLQKSALRF